MRGTGPKMTRVLQMYATLSFCHFSPCESHHFIFLLFPRPCLCRFLFCVTLMNLDTSGLGSMMLSDIRHLTSDGLLTPNTPQNQIFDQSTSLLMDQMHNTHTSPDSSLIVSAMTTVCALDVFFLSSEHLVLPS
jgi:hypothetical protein